MLAAAEVTESVVAGLGAMGGVAASMERMNLANCARLAASCRVSVPGVPAERWATFCRTASSELAEPLWKKVCGNAKRDNSEGGANPSAPRGGAPFWRTSLNAFESKVPTLRSSAINCVLEIRVASGGAL